MYHYQCETMIWFGHWNSLSENASPWRLDSISHHIQTCLPNKKPLDSFPRWLHKFAFSASFSRYSECFTLSSVLGCLIYLSMPQVSLFLFGYTFSWWLMRVFCVVCVEYFCYFCVFLSDCVFRPLNVYRLSCYVLQMSPLFYREGLVCM